MTAREEQRSDGARPKVADDGSGVGNDDFDDRLRGYVDTVFALLSHGPKRMEVRPRDPELRKLLGRLVALLGDAQRLHAAARIDGSQAKYILSLLDNPATRLANVDVALETVDELRKALLEVGDERFISMLLQNERGRERNLAGARGGRPAGSSLLLWSALYNDTPPPDTSAEWDVEKYRRLLADLLEARRERYRLDRARARMKRAYLLVFAPVLAVVSIGFGLVIAALIPVEDPALIVLLAAVSGALGGIVSGVRRLRDEAGRLGQLRTFGWGLVVQPLLGAMSGLVLLTVLNSGLFNVDTGGGDWANVGVLSFAAGFSEPFFIGVVSRITTLGDPPATAAVDAHPGDSGQVTPK